MQNEKKTRFEVGMPVIYYKNGCATKAKVTSISGNGNALLSSSYPVVIKWNFGMTEQDAIFTNEGHTSDSRAIPCLFTLPEYEALQALTASFIDGTFEAKKTEPQFIPQIGELVSLADFSTEEFRVLKIKGGIYSVEHIGKGWKQDKAFKMLLPVYGYEYANGYNTSNKYRQQDNP